MYCTRMPCLLCISLPVTELTDFKRWKTLRLSPFPVLITCDAGAVFGAGRGGPHDGARLGAVYSQRAYGCTSMVMQSHACLPL